MIIKQKCVGDVVKGEANLYLWAIYKSGDYKSRPLFLSNTYCSMTRRKVIFLSMVSKYLCQFLLELWTSLFIFNTMEYAENPWFCPDFPSFVMSEPIWIELCLSFKKWNSYDLIFKNQ